MLISFIVPAFNAEDTIEKCLKSIESQVCKKEIIVVNDGSTDKTSKIIKKFKVKFINQKNTGAASARNSGLRVVRGNYIAFVDSDCVLPKGWTPNALKKLKDKMIVGVGGPGKGEEDSLVSRSLDALLYGMRASVSERYVNSLATMNVMYKKAAIDGMFFDESFRGAAGEDVEFNFRLIKKGHKLLFSRDLIVRHYHPLGIGALSRKWYNYGKSFFRLHSKHPSMLGVGFYARVLYFPVLLAFLVASIFSQIFVWLAALQIILLFFIYFFIGIRCAKGKVILAFPFVHTIKQLSQMLGIWAGLFSRK